MLAEQHSDNGGWDECKNEVAKARELKLGVPRQNENKVGQLRRRAAERAVFPLEVRMLRFHACATAEQPT